MIGLALAILVTFVGLVLLIAAPLIVWALCVEAREADEAFEIRRSDRY